MEFLKRFFDDDSKIIGLCGFKKAKSYKTRSIEQEIFFNPFEKNISFAFNYETNFKNNVLLL